MNKNQQIQIHSKDQSHNKLHLLQQPLQNFKGEDDMIVDLTIPLQVQKHDDQLNGKQNLKEHESKQDGDQQNILDNLLKKPGCVDKGYILYSDTLIDKLIQNQKLNDMFLKQFQADREPVWTFQKEMMITPKNLSDLRVLCITWNMQGNIPSLCTKKLLNTENIQHHVVIISSQECQRSIPMSVFYENKGKWETQLSNELGNQYSLVKSVSMNALHLAIFLHNSVTKYATAFSTDSKATGIANLIGNKGGVGISMDIGDKSFLFINSHFASGQKSNPKRNDDYKKISQSLKLPKYYSNPNESLFNRFHYIFWMGDFNYRIDASNKNEVDEMIKKNQFFDLLKKDQLMAQKKIGQAFPEFQEGLILFPPTYKMQNSENKYSEGEDSRIPGWTDRIFFKQKHPNSITLLNYEMALNVFGSDHRPVFAQFLAKVNISENFQPIAIKESSSACTIF